MKPIKYIDRVTKEECEEVVFGGTSLKLLYEAGQWGKFLRQPFLYAIAKSSLFSRLYGFLQKSRRSKKKINNFIKKFQVDATEFVLEVKDFHSFNDFFTRQLKKSSRPLAEGIDTAIIPADGRYLFYPQLDQAEGFIVKGEKFDLAELLQNASLAAEYAKGSMVIARLCPADYHRFHFPCNCIPGKTRLINGFLYSVNPLAIKKNIHIFTQNKRTVCELQTERFGKVLFLEIGATNVGTIHQTYAPFCPHFKGDEKGFFSFGGSSLILLFLPQTITFDRDLTLYPYREIRCLMGQSLGTSLN